jgi:hypothetical protein
MRDVAYGAGAVAAAIARAGSTEKGGGLRAVGGGAGIEGHGGGGAAGGEGGEGVGRSGKGVGGGQCEGDALEGEAREDGF